MNEGNDWGVRDKHQKGFRECVEVKAREKLALRVGTERQNGFYTVMAKVVRN